MKNTIGQRRQRGFLVIAAVFLLVVLGGLVAYLMTVSTTSQAASAADLNAARAYQAARAGIEWGAYQILRDSGGTFTTACNGGTTTSSLTLGNFTATITCTASATITEGASSVRAYRIVSNGCNQPTCPAGSVASTYVERELSLNITN
ncbi:MAG: agglutinin biogenesis protein MshP [Burkholderiales bacterium]